jgi:beta-lactamase regulating signal transducer with metallopeptidase domain
MPVDWLSSWWIWAAGALVQSSVLLGAVWLFDRGLARRVWPELTSVLWLVALAPFAMPRELAPPADVLQPVGRAVERAAAAAPAEGALHWLFLAWAGVALALLTARAVQRARVARRLTRANLGSTWGPAWRAALERCAAAVGQRRVPAVAHLGGLSGPAVFGLWRPVLVLPRAWLGRAPCRRDEHALLHEMAHLAARDLWVDEALLALRAVAWFQPLAWVAVGRLRVLAELRCDQRVARALGPEAPSYRDTLLDFARALLARPVHGVRSFAEPAAIVARLERLARPPAASARPARLVSAALGLALATLALPMGSVGANSNDAGLRRQARQVLAAERAGSLQSCFSVQAAALVLAAEPLPPTPPRP